MLDQAITFTDTFESSNSMVVAKISKLDELKISDAPKIDLRMLNHWDNLDRTIEW